MLLPRHAQLDAVPNIFSISEIVDHVSTQISTSASLFLASKISFDREPSFVLTALIQAICITTPAKFIETLRNAVGGRSCTVTNTNLERNVTASRNPNSVHHSFRPPTAFRKVSINLARVVSEATLKGTPSCTTTGDEVAHEPALALRAWMVVPTCWFLP